MDAYICMCLWYVTDSFDGCMMVIMTYMRYMDVYIFRFYGAYVYYYMMHDVLIFRFSDDLEEKDLWCLIAFVYNGLKTWKCIIWLNGLFYNEYIDYNG